MFPEPTSNGINWGVPWYTCYTFPLESEVLRIVPIERIYKAPKYILVLVVTEYKQGCGVYSLEVVRTFIDLIRLA